MARWLQSVGAHGVGWFQRRRGRASIPAPIAWRRLLLGPLVIIAVGLLVSSPHFVKNALFYSNPIYPLAQNIFQSDPSHEKSAFFFEHLYPARRWLPEGEGLDRVWGSLKVFLMFSFESFYQASRKMPTTGSLFTLLLPCVLLVSRPRRIWFGIVVTFLAIMVWANTYLSARYLQSILPIATAVTAALIVRVWRVGWVARVGLIPLVLFQIAWGGDAMFYSGINRIKRSMELISSGHDGRRSDTQRFNQRLAQRAISAATPADAKILVRNYRTTLGIDREVLFDIQAWQSLFFIEPIEGPRGLYDLYASRGVTHLLYPYGQRPSVTKQMNVLFAELVYRYGKNRRRYDTLELVEMPDEPPPPDPPYQVVMLGVRFYPDGLYGIDQLNVYEKLPEDLRRQPEPKMAFGANENEDVELKRLLEQASAVVVGRQAGVGAIQLVERRFVLAERWERFSIYVREDPNRDTKVNLIMALQPRGFGSQDGDEAAADSRQRGESDETSNDFAR